MQKASGFGEFLKECMKSACGRAFVGEWTDVDLGDRLGVTDRTIRHWLADKHPPPSNRLAELAIIFRFAVQERDGFKILDSDRYRKMYTSAGHKSVPHLPQGSSGVLEGMHVERRSEATASLSDFPANLPPSLLGRRQAVAAVLSAYLDSAAGQEPHMLAPLPSLFDLSALTSHDPSEAGDAAEQIIRLSRAIDQCNTAVWLGSKVPGSQRREACGRILMLLTALAWTEEGWQKLKQLGQASGRQQRIESLRHPQLVQAGIHAVAGESLQLTFDRDWLRDQRPGMSSDMPPAEVWHMAVGGANGLINPGVGLDYQQHLLQAVARVFALPFPAIQIDKRADQLNDFEVKLRARIRMRTRRHFNVDSRFMLSRLMPPDATDEVELLYEYATRLSCTPLAYTGASGNLVDGHEEELIAAIEECFDAIAHIQDLPR